jgi:hypothetical protein
MRQRFLEPFCYFVLLHLFFLMLIGLLLAIAPGKQTPPPAPQLVLSVDLSPSTPSLDTCPRRAMGGSFVLLFFFTGEAGQQQGHCVIEYTNEDMQQTLPLRQVYAMCAVGSSATVTYASYEDTEQVAAPGIGMMDVYLEPGECTNVFQVLQERTMDVTSVAIDPFYGGQGDDSQPIWPIHQAPTDECGGRADFFTIWSANGSSKLCFANAGLLKLSQPLQGVVLVCSGNNSGEVMLSTRLLTGLSLGIERYQCISPAQMLHETTISIDTIWIDPVR